jgi:carbamoyl-phosphate synthase small subunit
LKAYLILEDGSRFEGTAFGAAGDAVGEVVFNTGMTGYGEVLTDPSYAGQIVCMTYPLIGNYGVNDGDAESPAPRVKGYIVRELCEAPSNWAAAGTLDEYLKRFGIGGIQGIDTRALTRKIRESGVLRGKIVTREPEERDYADARGYLLKNPVNGVSAKQKYTVAGTAERVAVLDYGLKQNILRSLSRRGLHLTVYPNGTAAEEILSDAPDGILLTNGPGDPKDNIFEIAQLKKLLGKKPIFGICLGHQLLALAAGGDTGKLKYGHRGSNHPVKELAANRVFITSQNHGYAVLAESLQNAELTHVNWNDKTCEGLRYKDFPARSVQFHPEASPGPLDTGYLFDDFVTAMRNFKTGK